MLNDLGVAVGEGHIDQGQGQGNHQAGGHAGHKHGGNGQIHGDAVDNHGDAGGNDGAQGAGRGHQTRAGLLGVARFQHGGEHNGADGGHCGRAGAGKSGEDGAAEHGDDAQTAGQPAQDALGPVGQPLGDAAEIHQVAHQDKQGDGQQGERVQPVDQALGDHQDAGSRGGQIGHTGGQDGKGHRNTQQHQAEQSDKYERHTVSSSFFSRSTAILTRAWNMSSRPPTATEELMHHMGTDRAVLRLLREL